jgi:hypothetical protein
MSGSISAPIDLYISDVISGPRNDKSRLSLNNEIISLFEKAIDAINNLNPNTETRIISETNDKSIANEIKGKKSPSKVAAEIIEKTTEDGDVIEFKI